MSNYEPTNSRKTLPPDPEPTKVSVPTTLEGLQGGASPSPSISVFVELAHLGDHGSVKKPAEDARTHVTRTAGTDRGCCGYGLSDRFVRRPRGVASAGAAQPVAASSSPGHFGSGGQGTNARSGPAAGGSSGTVGNVAKSSFTLTTSAGQEVTVDEESSTKYEKGTTSAAKSAVAKGEHVLVLGTVSSTTIMATQVFVQTSGGGSQPSTAATVVPFQKGAAETSKQAGQIPASYRDPGRSSAERQPIRRPKPRWRPIQAESSTVS